MFPSASRKPTSTSLDREEGSPRVRVAMLRQLGPALIVVVLCIVATYFVPALEAARPWTPGDPIPGWNLLGRPFEGEAALEQDRKSVV